MPANTALRSLILAELQAYGAGLTLEGLHALVRQKLPATAQADVRDELGALRDAGFVAFADNPLAPGDAGLRQWTITQAGTLALRK
jgi:hypothetical protein